MQHIMLIFIVSLGLVGCLDEETKLFIQEETPKACKVLAEAKAIENTERYFLDSFEPLSSRTMELKTQYSALTPELKNHQNRWIGQIEAAPTLLEKYQLTLEALSQETDFQNSFKPQLQTTLKNADELFIQVVKFDFELKNLSRELLTAKYPFHVAQVLWDSKFEKIVREEFEWKKTRKKAKQVFFENAISDDYYQAKLWEAWTQKKEANQNYVTQLLTAVIQVRELLLHIQENSDHRMSELHALRRGYKRQYEKNHKWDVKREQYEISKKLHEARDANQIREGVYELRQAFNRAYLANDTQAMDEILGEFDVFKNSESLALEMKAWVGGIAESLKRRRKAL